jgi:hypothetical protein
MPDQLADQGISRDWTELAAIHALRVGTDHKVLPSFLQNVFDSFDHRSIYRLPEDNDIARPDPMQKEGDRGYDHVIPFLVFG